MATYKGIGFDTTNGRNRTGTSSDEISFDAQITATDAISVSAGGISVTGGTSTDTLTTTGDASVGGDLTVAGDIISRGTVDLVVQDNFIDLNAGNTSTTALSSGFTFSLNRNSSFTASTVTTFVAGVASTSNPTFTATDAGSSSLLAAGDVVFIAGAAQGSNDGLYVVNAVDQASFPQVVTIKGVGTVATNGNTPWAQTQFTADTGDTASAYKVDIKVIAIADGTNFPDAGGSAQAKGTTLEIYVAGATESDFTGNGDYSELGAASSLQTAYDTGNTITTASSTDIALTLTSGDFTATGAGAVSLTPTSASTFTSGGALTFTAGAASTWSTSAGALTITSAAACTWSTAAGNLAVTGAGGLELSDGTATLDLDGSGALTETGLVSINLSPSGAITLDGAAVSIDGTSASNLSTTGADLTVSTITSGNLTLSSVGTATLDADDSLTVQMDANAGGNKALTIQANNAGGGEGNVVIDADDNVNTQIAGTTVWGVDSGGGIIYGGNQLALTDSGNSSQYILLDGSNGSISFDQANGTANVISKAATASADDLEIKVTGNQDASLILEGQGSGADAIKIHTTTNGGGIDIDSVSFIVAEADDLITVRMDASDAANKAITLEANNGGSGQGNIALDADDNVDLKIAGVTKANLNSTRLQVSGITELDATGGAGLRFGAGGNLVDVILDEDNMASDDVNALATQQSIKAYVDSFGQANYLALLELTADGTGVAARDVIAIDASGNATKADADAIATCQVVGFALNTAAGGGNVFVAQVGVLGGFSGLSAGSKYYASTTAGGVTATAPSGSGDVVFQVGFAVAADMIAIQPAFIMEIG